MGNPLSLFTGCFGRQSSADPQNNDTASVTVAVALTGSHKYTISGYSLVSGGGAGKFLASKTFTVGGHDWAIRWYPDGRDQAGADAGYASVYIMAQGVPAAGNTVKAMFEFQLLSHDGEPHWEPMAASQVPRVFDVAGPMWGYGRFMLKSKLLEASGRNRYLKYDCLRIMCIVSVVTERPAEAVEACCDIAVPPSNYRQNFGRLLDSGVGADVAFDVGGKSFAAHRCVLAAQSPVFHAELYGGMRETRARRVKIEGMESAVFASLLHFIYNDALPECCPGGGEEEAAMAQHLLAAADRYGVETLKVMCAKKLREHLSVGNVAATLVLAEQHQCEHLKEACLDFVLNSATVEDVMATDGYSHLVTYRPALDEFIKKIVSSHRAKRSE